MIRFFYIFISYCHYGIFRTKRLKNADGKQIGMNVVYENNALREQALVQLSSNTSECRSYLRVYEELKTINTYAPIMRINNKYKHC